MAENIKREKLKRSAAAVAASAGVLIGGIFNSPADMPQDVLDRVPPPPAIELVIPDVPDDDEDALPEEEKQKKEKRHLSFATRLVLSIVISIVAWVLAWVAYTSLAPLLGPVMKFIARAVLIAAAGLITYASVAKAVLPDVPLKKILNRKVLLAVFLGACALSWGVKFIFSSMFVHN